MARAEEAAATDDERMQARREFERGLALVDQERWEDALEAFDSSLRTYPTQTALFNRALCYGLAGQPADAVRDLEAHLERYGETVDERRRAAVEEELERQRRRLGRISIEVDGGQVASVTVDGIEHGQTPLEEALIVNPGRHQVTLQAEGYESVSRWVTVGGGDETALVVALSRSDGGSEDSPITPVGGELEPSRGGRGLRIGGFVTAGVAVAALGVALGLFLWNNGQYDDWADEDAAIRASLQGGAPLGPGDLEAGQIDMQIRENDELGDTIQSVDAASWAMMAVGSAAAIASVVLFVLAPRRGRSSETALRFHPTPSGLLLSGGF